MEFITVIKLGGSAITDKSKECTPNIPVIQHAIEQLVGHNAPIILLHGGGSFAHPVVTRSKLNKGFIESQQAIALSETELNLDQLTRIIGASLLINKRPFVPLHPISFITIRNGQISRCFLDPVRRSLGLGVTPLMHGDMVFDEMKGWGVLSADKLATLLGSRLEVNRVLFGCDVDGVYSSNPKTSDGAELLTEITHSDASSLIRALKRETSHDASGGMLGKATEALKIARGGTESIIFNLRKQDSLSNILNGRRTSCTRFVPWN